MTTRKSVPIPDAAATGAVTARGATLAVAGGFAFGGLLVLGATATTANAQAGLATLFVLVVVGVGALIVAARRDVRRRAARAAAGEPPWAIDHEGPPDAAVRGVWRRGLPPAAFVLSTGSGGFLVQGAGHLMSGTWAGWRGVLAFLAASCVTALAILVYRAFQQGGVQVRTAQVPCVPGSRATFFVAMTAGGSRLCDTRLVLRCWGPRKDRSPGIVWSQEVNPPDDASPGPDEFIECAFDIPPRLPSHAPRAARPVHWHLVVAGRTNWGKVVEFMPVPVYAVPTGTPGAGVGS